MKNIFYRFFLILFLLCLPLIGIQAADRFVSFVPKENYFSLIQRGQPLPLLVDESDYAGVLRVAAQIQTDIQKVGSSAPGLLYHLPSSNCIIIGTIDHSQFIASLLKKGLINEKDLRGKNEKYILTTIAHPFSGVESALVIAGSDKLGTIYGMYELSRQIGVSPWYYWADVPIIHHSDVYIKPGIYTDGDPAVTYRGIFLNDEAPALTGWSKKTFGGYNHAFYEKVFELLLRLKANFLWPAMWDAKFYDDDPLNSKLADEYGIVMGTSHHEPMARAHKEWRLYGKGPWNYETNSAVLDTFWTHGIERMKNTRDIVTVGMRGNGDEPMSQHSNISLLEKIVKHQREIIAQVTGKKADKTPQIWALYKEVQDYYDKGMRVPDDVTLLFSDDNWGNVRKLPDVKAKPRKGGYGMYYHVDYVGDPRNYKWLNVSQMQRIWEQMNLTYRYGVNRLWVLNVGDLKPMEFPISFFLDEAWNPDAFSADSLMNYTQNWCKEQLGEGVASEAARLLTLYTFYNHRVTPELLNDSTYSLTHYEEFATVTHDYQLLERDALRLSQRISPSVKDAYDELILFPIQACANLYELYYALACNRQAVKNNIAGGENWAQKARDCYQRDSLLTYHYNKEIAGGKWDHMMDQTHIGYTYWQQPEKNVMPWVTDIPRPSAFIFKEENGYISMEAGDCALRTPGVIEIPYLGKTRSGMTTFPVTMDPSERQTYLEYQFITDYQGVAKLHLLFAPTLNFNANKGLRVAVSLDGGDEKIINFNGSYTENLWRHWVANAIIDNCSEWEIAKLDSHKLRIRFLDSGIVLEKILVDMGGLESSYLGAPESEIINKK